MSGFLGLDPERVAMLRVWLDEAANELLVLRSDDPVAREPLAAVHRVSHGLDGWARRCAALLGAAPLTGYHPVEPDRGDLRLAALSTWVVRGRQVWSDPLGPDGAVAGVDPVAEARAVGARLRFGRLEALLEPDGLVWLTGQLRRWHRDPAASAAFLDGLGAIGLDRLVGEDPHAAASLLAHLGLPPARLAQVGDAVLRSWIAGEMPWYLDAPLTELNVVDLVLGAVLADPVAAAAFFDATADRLDVVLFGANDPEPGRRLVAIVTDPATTTVADAGRRLRRVIELMRPNAILVSSDLRTVAIELRAFSPVGIDAIVRQLEIRSWLGSVAAPWQPWFAGTATEWGWSSTEGIDALVFIAGDATSAGALGEEMGASLARLVAAAPSGEQARGGAVDAAAFTAGAVAEVLRDAELDDLAERRALWGLVGSGLGLAAAAGTRALTAPLPPPVPMLAQAAVGLGLGAAIDAVDGDARSEAHRAARRELARRVATAHLLVGVLVECARRDGRLPTGLAARPTIDLDDPEALVAPGALDELRAWIQSPELPAALRTELDHAVLSVANPADLGDLMATLADS